LLVVLISCFILSGLIALPALAQTPPYQQTVIVSPTPGNAIASGNTLLAAVNGLPTGSWGTRYLVKIEPGVYDLQGTPLVMKQWIDIEGSGRETTLLRGRGVAGVPSTGVVHGADYAELRSLTIQVFDGDSAIGILNDGASGRFTDLQITVNNSSTCWGFRNLNNSEPRIKNVGIYVNCSAYNSGVTARGASRVTLEDVSIRSFGAFGSTSNIGIWLNPDSLPYEVRGVDIKVGDGSSPGTGINFGNAGGYGGGWLEIVETLISTNGGVGIRSESGIPLSLKIRHSNLVGNDIGIEVPENWIFIHNSLVAGTTSTVYSASGVVRVGASHLEGGPLVAVGSTCAGVYDEAYAFFPNTCP
jgi:hypothetical protein